MTTLIAAMDLGKASVGLVKARIGGAGLPELESILRQSHEGRPLELFTELYLAHKLSSCAALVATGLYAQDLKPPVITGLPEGACMEAALELLPGGPLNLLSAGARGYYALARQADGQVLFAENDKCSSGTGETMIKIAGRFGLSLEEANRLARSSTRSIPITARCSVFAKSEMTHFGNQGRPAAQLFRGYFESIANNVVGLLERVRGEGPVYLVGGCSQIEAFVEALGRTLEQEVIVPEHARAMEAIGAILLVKGGVAGWNGRGGISLADSPLPEDPGALIQRKQVELTTHEPAAGAASRVRFLQPAAGSPSLEPSGGSLEPAGDDQIGDTSAKRSQGKTRVRQQSVPLPDEIAAPMVLGLDLGSTGSKAVLVSLDSGEALRDVYDRTRGNPVEATQRLVKALLSTEFSDLDIRAIGVTGSGREAAATVLRAAFPEEVDRIFVENEIVAHATAAIRCDEEEGRELSIIEIGGQDAKFIQVVGGQIVESDMNKACSAGTGSFLEEQAIFYGVDDIEEFGRLASTSTRPPNLGQMCTVFVADAAAEALKQGFDIPDIFAGFQYSVIHNYLNRVMGQRTLGSRVFFQGKPATSPSLARTLASVTGKEVVVPPNPGAMGAWGIALCAKRALGLESLNRSSSLALNKLLEAKVVSRDEFVCRDSSCKTFCSIDRTTVAVAEQAQTVLSGGACPKYEISGAGSARPPKEAPNAFEEWDALLEPFSRMTGSSCSSMISRPSGEPGGPPLTNTTRSIRAHTLQDGRVVGIPMVGDVYRLLPYFSTFFSTLGFQVCVLKPPRDALRRGERRCKSSDVCCPVKLAHGIETDGCDLLFVPKVISVEETRGTSNRTCTMRQALPEMLEASFTARGISIPLLRPRLFLGEGLEAATVRDAWLEVGEALGADRTKVVAAQHAAFRAQRKFERERQKIGERTLAYARERGWPVVLLCGSLHVIHEKQINAGLPRLLRENGALPLPVDCFPLPSRSSRLESLYWADSDRLIRASLAARARGDVYPLLLSSFGCGPGSFTEQLFHSVLEGYPHTMLESDGHGGTAGYVTRVQAFLHAVRGHDNKPNPLPPERLNFANALSDARLEDFRGAKIVIFSMARHLPEMIAGIFRSFGLDAVAAGQTNPSTFAHGKRDCSGKECLPYQMIWGAFRAYLEANPPTQRTILLEIQGVSACRNGMFSTRDRLVLERMKLDHLVEVRHFRATYTPGFTAKIIGGFLIWDIIKQLHAYYGVLDPRESERLYHQHSEALIRILEQPWFDGPPHCEPTDGRSMLRGGAQARFIGGPSRRRGGARAWLNGGPSRRRGEVLARFNGGPSRRRGGAQARFNGGPSRRRGGARAWLNLARPPLRMGLDFRLITQLLDQACEDFSALAARSPARSDHPTVLLTGDIYVRQDEFSGDQILERLHESGLKVLLEPVLFLAEYLAEIRSSDLMGLPTTPLEHAVVQRGMNWLRQWCYSRASRKHPWLVAPPMPEVLGHTQSLLDQYPHGEAPVTIGSALYHWENGLCDGAVVAGPWGCGPALISESLLSHRRDIPLLFLYNDGHSLDDRRISHFAFRLRAGKSAPADSHPLE